MPQAKKKTATKTAAKKRTCATKKCTKTCTKKTNNKAEKYHIYVVTALSMILAILLCADIAFLAA